MPRLRVVDVPVSELRVYTRNPRTISESRFAQLQRTVQAHPDLLDARPLIALPDGTVIAGNMRLLAARALGRETVPTVYADLDEDQATQWLLLDNRTFGEDNEDLAAELLAELEARGGDLDLTGFARDETDALLRGLLQRDRDPDEVLPLEAGVAESKLGEVYVLGGSRLMCGDATDPDHVATLLAGAAPALIVTDPPYGVSLDNGWRDRAGLNRRASRTGADAASSVSAARSRTSAHLTTTIVGDERVDWSEAYALVPSCTVIYLWHASRYACEVQAGLERIGFSVKQQIIWDKGLFVLSRQEYNWQHEPCLYAKREGARVEWLGPANQSTLWQAASPKMIAAASRGAGDERVDHPSQKPVLLFSRPIENHLRAGEAFYDPFAGSGSALIAASVTGRRCYAMEIDPHFCDLIRRRYEAFTCVR